MVSFTALAISVLAATAASEASPQRPGRPGRPQPCPPTGPGGVTVGNHVYRIDNVEIRKNNDYRTTGVRFQLHNTAGFQQDVNCSPTEILSGQAVPEGQFVDGRLYSCFQGSPWKFSFYPDRNGLQIKHGNYHQLNSMLVGTTTIPTRCDNQGFGRGEICRDTSNTYVSIMQNSS